MKLKTFSPATIPTSGGPGKSKVPAIGLSIKAGVFRLNSRACELLNLAAGDEVQIHQDEEDAENWYIEKVKSEGYKLRENKKLTPGLSFNSTFTAKQIAESVSFSGTGGKILIAGQPTKFDKRLLYGLLLTSLRN